VLATFSKTFAATLAESSPKLDEIRIAGTLSDTIVFNYSSSEIISRRFRQRSDIPSIG